MSVFVPIALIVGAFIYTLVMITVAAVAMVVFASGGTKRISVNFGPTLLVVSILLSAAAYTGTLV